MATPNSSQSITARATPTKASGPSLEKMMAACALVNKVRISKGWNVLTAEEAEITANVWIELLDREAVPPRAYDELFKRAVSANANKRSQGVQPPEITPEYLLAFWVGSEGLRSEMAGVSALDEEAEKRKSECRACFGVGMEYVRDGNGTILGVKGKCKHGAE